MKYLITGAFAFLIINVCLAQNNTWTTRGDFPGTARNLSTSFTIGDKIYVMFGADETNTELTDVWEYNAVTDAWDAKDDFPGGGRKGAVGFAINGKGYIAFGGTSEGTLIDTWEYDPAADEWTRKADCTGLATFGAFVFVADGKAYVGAGQSIPDGMQNELWQYDPAGDEWTQKTSLPASERTSAVAFAIGTKGYVGLGIDDEAETLNDFWEYNTANDQWTQKASYPADTGAPVAFATSTRGYVGVGTLGELWSYYPGENGWVKEANFPAPGYPNATCSFADGRAYVLNGGTASLDLKLYQYTPATDQTITFTLPTKTFGDAAFDLTATSSASLPITYTSSNTSVATIDGKTVTIVGGGTSIITARADGNATFDAAPFTFRTFTVNKANQTIAFDALDDKDIHEAPFDLTATASSALAVTYSSSNTAVATISGSTVTIVAPGTTTITASQAGNSNYNSTTKDQPFTVTQGIHKWIGSLPTTGGYGNKITLTLHLNSGLPYTLTSSNTNIATVAKEGSDWVVTPVGIGTTTLTAVSGSDEDYDPAPDLNSDLVISKGTQTITFDEIPPKVTGDPAFLVFPTASSGLPVTIESDIPANDYAFGGNYIVPVKSMSATITAKQAGNDFYLPAQVSRAFVVSPRDTPMEIEAIPVKALGDKPFRPSMIPGYSAVTFSSNNLAVAKIENGLVTIVGIGTAKITATRNTDYGLTAKIASTDLVVKGSQTIEFNTIGEKNISDDPFQVTATSSAGLPITFSSSDPAIATVSGTTVTITGAGSTFITATAAGDDTHASVTTSELLVVKGPVQSELEQGQLWGVQMYGGKNLTGSVFATNSDGTGVNIVKDFEASLDIGSNPQGTLTLASNGKYYGSTRNGGAYNFGVLFEYDATTGTITKKFDYFNADVPLGKWVATADGKLYGVKTAGETGAYSNAILVEFDVAAGTFTKYLNLSLTMNNISDIFASSSGKIYITGADPTNPTRLFFEYSPATNTITKIAELSILGYGGFSPVEVDGKFYGTTGVGGIDNNGSIIEFDPAAGTATVKLDFEQSTYNTTTPQGLMRASNGKIYGIAQWGGTGLNGRIYEYNPAQNTTTTVAEFPPNIGLPVGLLREAPDGKLYAAGTLGAGGHIFQFDPANNSLVIQALLSDNTGRNIYGSLTLAGDKFLALAQDGGGKQGGVLTEYDYTSRTFERKVDFGAGEDGWAPISDLVQASNGKLYGLTKFGGARNAGVIYEIDPATNDYRKVYDFGTSDVGSTPDNALIAGYNGKLYGATTNGPTFTGGAIFEFDPSSSNVSVVTFIGQYGYPVNSKMVPLKNGKLIAAASFSGDFNAGTIIEIDPAGKQSKRLFAFNGTNGRYPHNGVMMASNGKVYGTTATGGDNDKGVLFELDLETNEVAVRHHFDGATGEGSNGVLTEVNGKLYGVSPRGGSNSTGVLFEYDLETETCILKKNFTTEIGGNYPGGGLLLAANGKLYGNTLSATSVISGTIFEYDPVADVLSTKQQLGKTGGQYGDVTTGLIQTLKSNKTNQTITIDPIETKVLGGSAFTPTATSTSGLPVVFTAGNDKITVGANNSVTLAKAGKAIIKANQAGGPSFNAAPEVEASFCINPAKPNISSSGANTGSMQLTSSNTSGNQWYLDGTAIAAATGVSYTVKAPGIYTVQSTVEECESEMSNEFPVIITGDIANNNIIALYPNPVQERLYITLPGSNQKRITLLQTDGRIAEEHHTSANTLEIDVRNYSAGLYLVRIADETGVHPTIKFIKK